MVTEKEELAQPGWELISYSTYACSYLVVHVRRLVPQSLSPCTGGKAQALEKQKQFVLLSVYKLKWNVLAMTEKPFGHLLRSRLTCLKTH